MNAIVWILDQIWCGKCKCRGHLNFSLNRYHLIIIPITPPLATLYLLWDVMNSMAGRGSDKVGGPRIWTYRLKRKALMEFLSDRRRVGSDLGSFGITWFISWLTKVTISLQLGNSACRGISLNLEIRFVFLLRFLLSCRHDSVWVWYLSLV